MKRNLQKFGKTLYNLRIKRGLTLREMCRKANYDPSNWSKIERGIIPPPSDDKILRKWTKILGINSKAKIEEFVDGAKIAQGIIPQDILSQENAVRYLPAFFRTARNEKPTKEDVDKLIELIRKS